MQPEYEWMLASTMLLDSELFDQLVGRVAGKRNMKPLPVFTEVTLAAALQLELAHRISGFDQVGLLCDSVADQELLVSVRERMEKALSTKLTISDSPTWEIFDLSKKEAFIGSEWDLLRMRFVRAVRMQAPNADRFAQAMSVCLTEMADNVFQHAEENGEPVAALAAYGVTPNTLNFAVTDFGRGAKSSLRANPRWREIASEHDALHAIIFQEATSRPNVSFGNGYKDLFRALVDRDAAITLKSLEAKYNLGRSRTGERTSRARSRASYPGFTVEITALLSGANTQGSFCFTSSPE